MRRRWNLLPFVGFLVVVGAFLSYFLLFALFPVTRDVPWVNFLLFLFGLGLLGLGLKRAFGRPEQYRGKITGSVLSVLSVVIFGLFLFYNFSFSQQLPASEEAPRVGQKALDFTLPDKDGNPVTLSDLWQSDGNQWVLLVFYRGYW